MMNPSLEGEGCLKPDAMNTWTFTISDGQEKTWHAHGNHHGRMDANNGIKDITSQPA